MLLTTLGLLRMASATHCLTACATSERSETSVRLEHAVRQSVAEAMHNTYMWGDDSPVEECETKLLQNYRKSPGISEAQMRGPLYIMAQRRGAWSHVPHL